MKETNPNLLNESEILEQITDAFISLDKDWNYTYLNSNAAAILNKTKEELIGKNVWELFPESVGLPFHKAYLEAMKTQKYIHLEEHYAPMNLWFENHIYPSKGGISVFIRETTEKKKAEEEILTKGNFIESIINSSPDIIYIYDIEEKKNVFVNNGIQTNLGYTDAEIKAMGDRVLPLLMHPDDFQYYLNYTYPGYASAKDKEIIQHEFSMHDKSGNWHWLSCKESVFLRKENGIPKQIFGITVDITEQKKVELELRSEKDRFEKIVGSVPGVIYSVKLRPDGTSCYPYLSPGMSEMFGLNTEELKENSSPLMQRIHPDDIEKTWKLILESAQNMTESRLEFRFEHPQKGWIWIEANSFPEAYPDGSTVWTGFVSDTTERKIADEKINYQASLLANVNDAVIASDENFILTSWNRSAERLYGWKEEEVIGKPAKSIIQTEFISINRTEAIQQLITKGEYFSVVINNRKDGSKFFVEVRATALRDANGKTTGYVSINRDITDRKKAEERLMQSEENYKQIVETAQEAIWVVDANNITTFVNKKSCEMLEYTFEELLNKSFLEFLDEEDKMKALQQIETQNEHPDSRYEYKVFTKSGRQIWVMVASSPILDSENKYLGSLAMISDITERKKAEEEILSMNEQLRNLTTRLQTIREEERTEMAHDIHDVLGQQLTLVKMHLHKLTKNNKNQSEEFKLQSEIISKSINETVDTVRRLALDLHPIILDDQGLAEALKWQSDEFSKSSNIECIFTSIGKEVPADVALNTQIFRIYQEALTNVARYSKATQVKATLRTEGGFLKLMVSDNGVGFNPSKISGKKSLGLVMMRERAYGIGAEISIISEPLQGTSILLTLPISN